MKTPFVLVGAALLLIGSAGCHIEISIPSSASSSSSSRSWKVEAKTVCSGAIPSDVRVLDVENHNGSVRIVGSESEAGGWTQTLKVRAVDDVVSRRLIESATCKASGSTELRLVVAVTDREEGSFSSDLEITVPKHVVVRTGNHYGPLTVSSISTNVEASNQAGMIEIGDVGGSVKAGTSYAALKVRNCGLASLKNQCGSIDATDIHGALEADTSYASLNVRRVAGSVKLRDQCGSVDVQDVEEADAETSYATLRVSNASGKVRLINQCGSVNADRIAGDLVARTSYGSLDVCGSGQSLVCENQCGSVRVRATSDAVKEIRAKTSYARLEAQVPAHLKPAIQAHTSYAKVKSDFPLLTGSQATQQAGDGAPRIQLENQAGEIVITGNPVRAAK